MIVGNICVCIFDSVFFYGLFVFGMAHFRGPTVRGPICHFLEVVSWAPDNWAPGPDCPGPNCPGPNCPGPNSPRTVSSTLILLWSFPHLFWLCFWFLIVFCSFSDLSLLCFALFDCFVVSVCFTIVLRPNCLPSNYPILKLCFYSPIWRQD